MHCTADQTPPSSLCTETLLNLWGILNTNMLLLNEHHASSEERTSSDQETCWPLSLEATCNDKFLLIDLEKTVPVQMYFWMAKGFECFIALSAEDYDTPLWRANRHKDFLRLASIWVLISSITAVKTWHFGIFFFCPPLSLSFKNCSLFCISLYYMALITWDIHYKPSNNIFPQHILSKSIANEQFLLKLLLLLLLFCQAH
jgi:hypothetical protein